MIAILNPVLNQQQGGGVVPPDPPVQAGRGIEFINPFPVQKVWRTGGGAYTGTVTVPVGYTSVLWSICDERSGIAAAMGTTSEVTWTPEFTHGSNVFQLRTMAVRAGYPVVDRTFYGEITVLPERGTEANAEIVYNLASGGTGSKPGGWDSGTDRSNIAAYNPATAYSAGTNVKLNGKYYKSKVGSNQGNNPETSPVQWQRIYSYVIWVKGNYTGSATFNPYYWYSSDLTFPVHFQVDDITISTSGRFFDAGSSYNTIWDGCCSESVQYGYKGVNNGTPVNQQRGIYNLVDDPRPDLKSHYITICGFDLNNGAVSSGGTCFQITTRPNLWDTPAERIAVFNMRARNARDESYYLCKFNDSASDQPLSYPLFYRLVAADGGNEGIQHSSFINGKVFHCTITNPGVRNDPDHRNAYQFGGGNVNTVAMGNYIETSKNILNASNGLHGTNIFFTANYIVSTGKTGADGANMNVIIEESINVPDETNIRVKNNTMLIKGSADPGRVNYPATLYYQATNTVANKLRFDGNLVVSNNRADFHEFGNGWVPGSQLVEDNLQYLDEFYAPMFWNMDANDLRLATLLSPAFVSRSVFTPERDELERDFYGYKYVSTPYGADAGIPLVTGTALVRDIDSIAAQAPVTGVPNGTVWNDAVGLLPSQVLVTNDDNSTRLLDVTWAQGSYNGSVDDTYTVFGTVTLPADITNTGNVQASVDITVDAAVAGLVLNISLGSTRIKQTSTTSQNLTTLGSTFSMTVASGLNYTANQPLRIFSRANPSVDYIDCDVSSYSSTTLSLKNAVVHGSGAHTDWDIDLKNWAVTASLNNMSVSPFPGSAITRDYGQITLHGVNTGIGIRALNAAPNVWNNVFTTGVDTGSNSGTMPDDVLMDGWFCDAVAQPATLELYDFGGSGILAAGAVRIRATASRNAGGPRTVAFQVNAASEQNLDAAGNSASRVEFTGVSAVAGVIQIKIRTVAPNGGGTFGYINGIEIFR